MREESAPAPNFGSPHRHFARTDSTNTRARELAEAGAPHGTVVTAAEQSGGRGRQGRTWTAPAGKALLYSAIVRPLDDRHLVLPLAVPLAVCAAAEQLAPGIECGVKWPNDVHVDGRKLSGVLIEARPQDGWAVIGIGLNLTIQPDEFPPELRNTAISLSSCPGSAEPVPGGPGAEPVEGVQGESRRSLPAVAQTGLPLDPRHASAAVNRHLDRWTSAEPHEVLAEWRRRDVLKGLEVAWEGGSGVADGVDDRGYLLVVTPGGDRVAVGAGEIHIGRS